MAAWEQLMLMWAQQPRHRTLGALAGGLGSGISAGSAEAFKELLWRYGPRGRYERRKEALPYAFMGGKPSEIEEWLETGRGDVLREPMEMPKEGASDTGSKIIPFPQTTPRLQLTQPTKLSLGDTGKPAFEYEFLKETPQLPPPKDLAYDEYMRRYWQLLRGV